MGSTERVKAGEALAVTERGHPVAVLAPLRNPDEVIERLRAQGCTVERDAQIRTFGGGVRR